VPPCLSKKCTLRWSPKSRQTCTPRPGFADTLATPGCRGILQLAYMRASSFQDQEPFPALSRTSLLQSREVLAANHLVVGCGDGAITAQRLVCPRREAPGLSESRDPVRRQALLIDIQKWEWSVGLSYRKRSKQAALEAPTQPGRGRRGSRESDVMGGSANAILQSFRFAHAKSRMKPLVHSWQQYSGDVPPVYGRATPGRQKTQDSLALLP
jgi:hypothetical protein